MHPIVENPAMPREKRDYLAGLHKLETQRQNHALCCAMYTQAFAQDLVDNLDRLEDFLPTEKEGGVPAELAQAFVESMAADMTARRAAMERLLAAVEALPYSSNGGRVRNALRARIIALTPPLTD